MNILIACEQSQVVCNAFRNKGHNAFSCDILPCSDIHSEWHIQDDVLNILHGGKFYTQNGNEYYIDNWDMIIAHPPCTYLTVTGNRWFNVDKYGINAINRYNLRIQAIKFFMEFPFLECSKICIENPVGIMSSFYKKPNQIIQPYMFGDYVEKKTCLWLKGLPELIPTNIVNPPPRIKFKSGKTMPGWYADLWKLPGEERQKIRSTTFPGIALAMAEQWG